MVKYIKEKKSMFFNTVLKKHFFILIFSITIMILINFSCTIGGITNNSSNNIDNNKLKMTPYTDLGFTEVKINTTINFYTIEDNAIIYYDVTTDLNAKSPCKWIEGTSYIFDTTGDIKLFIKDLSNNIESEIFQAVYSVISEDQVFTPLSNIQMSLIHKDASIEFTTRTDETVIEVGYNTDISADQPEGDIWITNTSFTFDATGDIKVFAKATKSGMQPSSYYTRIYTVVDSYPRAAEQSASEAIYMNDSSIKSWANGYANYIVGDDCNAEWQTPNKACGHAVGTNYDIVCLGRAGQITMTFPNGIADGEGFDFTVFENSFSDTYLELAFIELSTNGMDFIKFDNASLTDNTIDAFGSLETTKIYGLAGKYKQGYGTPFDLSDLAEKQDVINGKVNLLNIQYVRIIDINGNGDTRDSFDNSIYDPYPCIGSAGFDLDAIGVINEAY